MRLPEWIKTDGRPGGLRETRQLLRRHRLSTVCEEARCPNKAECFKRPTATFLILGQSCTRNCGFCSVTKGVTPLPPDADEPRRVTEAAKEMGLKYVVLTSPTRDDLPDGGAGHFAETVARLRQGIPGVKVEVLTPDFKGSFEALRVVLEAGPDVFNHNVETVPSLYRTVRPGAEYNRSINIIREAGRFAREHGMKISTKSGLMVGLGETFPEVLSVFTDLRDVDCDFLTIGQYLMPSRRSLQVREYIRPEVFELYRSEALGMGFINVASAPLCRSSMDAQEVYENVDAGNI